MSQARHPNQTDRRRGAKELFCGLLKSANDGLILPNKGSVQRTTSKSSIDLNYFTYAQSQCAQPETGRPLRQWENDTLEALAFELMYPLIVIRYESLVGSYLGRPLAD